MIKLAAKSFVCGFFGLCGMYAAIAVLTEMAIIDADHAMHTTVIKVEKDEPEGDT